MIGTLSVSNVETLDFNCSFSLVKFSTCERIVCISLAAKMLRTKERASEGLSGSSYKAT